MSDRPHISAEVKRQLFTDSGHKCSVCGESTELQTAHIVPFHVSQDDSYENLICLCANCHGRADKEKWGERTLSQYKLRPWVRRKYTNDPSARPPMTKIKIRIDMEYKDCDPTSLSHLKHALAGFLRIPPEYVVLTLVGEGSVLILVVLPHVEAERLMRAFETKDPALSEHLGPFHLLGVNADLGSHEHPQHPGTLPDDRAMIDFKIDYILFTHLPDEDKAWEALSNQAERLADCLENVAAPGMLVVFVDVGWLSLLNTIGTDFDPVKMAQEFGRIVELKEKIDALKKEHRKLERRLRLVTAETLYEILNNLRGDKPGLAASRLKNFLVGNDPGVRYDTTKVVEAIIRVRHLGSGIPVLRVDWDALLGKETLSGRLLDTTTQQVFRYCESLAADHRIHSYVISGSYKPPEGKSRDAYQHWNISDFNTAFATRMFPALVPTDDALKFLNDLTVEEEDKQGNPIVVDGPLTEKDRPQKDSRGRDACTVEDLESQGCLDSDVMIRYYGLENGDTGLPRLGSDPKQSVVSGAGLVISEGAILDLPPFSNFQQNVMWIDDYLKYVLHRALDHFARGQTPSGSLEIPCRHPSSFVYKDRPLGGQKNLRPYTLGGYIPTLFWGILVDGWIRGEPYRPNAKSPFVEALDGALKRGLFNESERRELRFALEMAAIARINVLISLWSQLKTRDETLSFAALWVAGEKPRIEKVMDGLTTPPDGWPGWGLLKMPMTKIPNLDFLRDPIRKIVYQTLDDMCTYIDWALEWPIFVQSVRAVRTGSLELDVSYDPSRKNRTR